MLPPGTSGCSQPRPIRLARSSLAERLTSIGCDPRRALALARERVGPSALEHYLGAARPRLVAELDHNWKKSVRLEWVEQHRQAENEKPELARLEHASTLPLEELVQRALLTEKFCDADAALARNRELLDTEADAYARLTIGRLLLARGETTKDCAGSTRLPSATGRPYWSPACSRTAISASTDATRRPKGSATLRAAVRAARESRERTRGHHARRTRQARPARPSA